MVLAKKTISDVVSKDGLLRSQYSFSLFVLILLNLASPRIISWDGYLYLSSGKSLFTSDMNFWYHWAREPGYPFIIWLSLQLGSLQYLFLAQNIALAFACVLFVKSWNCNSQLRMSETVSRISIVLMIFGLHGYANSVLQTVWYIFLCSVLTYLITHRHSQKGLFLKLMPVIGVCSSLLAVGMAFAFLVLSMLLIAQKVLRTRAYAPSLLLSIFLCLAVSAGWITIKNSFDFRESKFQGINSAFDSLTAYTGNQPLATTIDQIVQTPFSLIGVAPERYNGIPTQTLSGEAKIFGASRFEESHLCGLLYPGPGDFPAYVSEYTKFSCLPWGVVKFVSYIGKITGLLLFPVAGLCTLLLFIWTIFQKRETWLLLIPVSLIELPYILLGAGISRYGAPIFPLSILALMNVKKLVSRLK
jgi:hypothetical protein